MLVITKTYLYNFDPLKPLLYSKTGVYRGIHSFSYFCWKHRLCNSLEPPRRGGSNEYPQSMFWAEIWKISEFLSENFLFLVVKFSIYLNRRVFIMKTTANYVGWRHKSRISPWKYKWRYQETSVTITKRSPPEAPKKRKRKINPSKWHNQAMNISQCWWRNPNKWYNHSYLSIFLYV